MPIIKLYVLECDLCPKRYKHGQSYEHWHILIEHATARDWTVSMGENVRCPKCKPKEGNHE